MAPTPMVLTFGSTAGPKLSVFRKKISSFPENYNSALPPAAQLKPPYYGLWMSGRPEVRTLERTHVPTSKRPDVRMSGHPDNQTCRRPDVRTSGCPDVRTSELPDVPTSRRLDVRASGRPDVRTSGRAFI